MALHMMTDAIKPFAGRHLRYCSSIGHDEMAETTLEAIRLSAAEGRLSNPYFRKSQLGKLHGVLRSNSQALQDAIKHDSGHTIAEAKVQYLLALRCVEVAYQSLNPSKCLEDEYSVAKGKSAPLAEEPAGVAVIIEPSRHTYVYSLMSALAPALAAGNVIVNKVGNCG
jgi:acyl-CoA reductase-like NAD-dependent aldehyde dehydrogenase